MKRTLKLKHEFVEYIPDNIKNGTIYVSVTFATAVHKCCCGCGQEVVTPISPTDWKLIFDGETISLYPSIGNWGFPCQSHYWIDGGEIVWAKKWSPEQIAAGYKAQEEREHAYYTNNRRGGNSIASKVWHWLRSIAR